MPPARSAYRPRKTPTQQRAWRTRERIVAAAARVFAEHGYGSGTTDRIAAEAGLSIGSLYQYFPNKGAILAALTQAHLENASGVVRTHLAERRPLADWLPELTRALVDLHAADPRLHRVLFDETPRPPELLARFREVTDETVTAVATLLRGDPGVAVPAPERSARFVVAIIESLIHRMVGPAPDLDAAELSEEIVVIVTRYLNALQ